MSGVSKIEWCDATFNPWWGCERVSPACAHCYADTWAKRVGMGDLWPRGKTSEHGFRFFGDKHWAEPLKWARTLPAKLGRRPRVFCASMADVFEELPHLDEHRLRLMMLIERTPELDWLLLTKRPEFARDWLTRWYGAVDRGNFPPGTRAERPCRNVWVGVSIENARYTWRADVLREIPAAVRFISAEPLLGSVFAWEPRRPATAALIGASAAARLQRERAALDLTGIDWVIIGGESGPGARPFHLEHARELIEQVYSHRAHEHRGYGSPAIFVKQLGARPLGAAFVAGDPLTLTGDHTPLQLRDRKGGDWDEWPTDLRIREYPASAALRASDELMETA